jgi:glyoxylase-like metal-dependent hydrolase (beta-lactamase superfamily II)
VDVQVTEVAQGVWQARAKHVAWVLVTEGDEVTLVDTGYPGARRGSSPPSRRWEGALPP